MINEIKILDYHRLVLENECRKTPSNCNKVWHAVNEINYLNWLQVTYRVLDEMRRI